MNLDLSGEELANALANHLSDLEFELLIRARIKMAFIRATTSQPNLEEHHHACSFRYSWGDKSSWHVSVGTTYSDQVDNKGEVLRISVENAVYQWTLQSTNKMSLLIGLSAPNKPLVENVPNTALPIRDETEF